MLNKGSQGRTSRRQQNLLSKKLQKKGWLIPVTVKKDGSGLAVDLSFSDKALSEIWSGVTTKVLGASQEALGQFNANINKSNALFTSMYGLLDRLFFFETASAYASSLASALRAAQDLRQVTQGCFTDQLAAKLKHPKLPSREVLKAEFQKRYARKLRLPKNSQLSFDVEAVVDSYLSAVDTFGKTVTKNEPLFSDRLRIAKSLEAILAEAVRVAEEGSPKAAHLYFTRLVRHLVLENIAPDKRVTAFLSVTPRLLHVIGFKDNLFVKLLASVFKVSDQLDYTNSYVAVGKLGLEDLLSAIDHEERRTRFRNRAMYGFKTHTNFSADPLYAAVFAGKLQEIGASPGSAAEILVEVPIGQRKGMFELLYRKPMFVKLYEQLKEAGIEAREVMPFLRELSDVEVQINGERVSLYNVVSRLASQEGQRGGAAWLVRHPEVWSSEDLQRIIEVASSDLQKLEQVTTLHQQPPVAVQNAVTGKTEVSRPPSSAKENKSSAVLWAEISFQHNPIIAKALISAYERTPPHLHYRIRQVYSHVKEHHHPESREGVLLSYVSQLNQVSSELRQYLLRNDSFFEAFLRRASEAGFVKELEKIVAESSNPYSDLLKSPLLKAQEKRGLAIQMILNPLRGAPNDGSLGEVSLGDGVVYTIVIVGNIDSKIQAAIGERLLPEGIEPVFLHPDARGQPPDCDAVLIFPGAKTPHSSAARDYYRRHGFPVRTVSGGYGAGPVVRSAVNFRDELALNGRQKLSA